MYILKMSNMPGVDDLQTNCDGDTVVKTTSPGLYDDSEYNMEFLGERYDKYTYKKFLDPQMRWLHCRSPRVYKRKKLKNKHLTAVQSSCWNCEHKFNKLSLGNLNFCHCYEQHKECKRMSSLEMDRAVGIIYPCLIDVNRNKSNLRSSTNIHGGKKVKELTTVYKRECNMSSLSTTTDSGMLTSSAKIHYEILKQVPSTKLNCDTPESPESIVEGTLLDKITPLKKDNTGYFEVVSPSDDLKPVKKVHKHNFHSKHKEHKKTKVQLISNSPTLMNDESKEKKSHKSKREKQLAPIIEHKSEIVPSETTNIRCTSYHSIIKKKCNIHDSIPIDDNDDQLNSEPIYPSCCYDVKRCDKKITSQKEDVKKVCFMELDNIPTKINKEIDTKHLVRTTMKDKSLSTSKSIEYVNNVQMEDKSLSVHISSCSEDHKLSPSITNILNELLLDPEYEKIIKSVLHHLARKAALRQSLSNTIFELKGKQKLGILKRKSSGSIQNVSSSDLDRLHFEKYKTSVDAAIKMLEERMTKKIYDALRSKEYKRKCKETKGKCCNDIPYNVDKLDIKEKPQRVKYDFLQNRSSTDMVTIDSKDLDERSSLPSFKEQVGRYNSDFSSITSDYNTHDFELPERPFPKEDLITTTLAYNVHVSPSNTNPFKKIRGQTTHDSSNNSRNSQSLRNAFSIPRQVDLYQPQSNTSHSINIPGDETANNLQTIGEGTPSFPASSHQDVLRREENKPETRPGVEIGSILLKETRSDLKITNSSTRMNNTAFTPLLEDVELTEPKENPLPSFKLASADLSKEDITQSKPSYTRGFRDVQIYRHETRRRKEEKHPRDKHNREALPGYQTDGSLSSEPLYYKRKLHAQPIKENHARKEGNSPPRMERHRNMYTKHPDLHLEESVDQRNESSSRNSRGATSKRFTDGDENRNRLLLERSTSPTDSNTDAPARPNENKLKASSIEKSDFKRPNDTDTNNKFIQPTDLSRSKKNAYYSKNEDTQSRLPAIQESLESALNNSNISSSRNGFYSGYPNKHKVPEDVKLGYGIKLQSESGPEYRYTQKKADTLFQNERYTAPNATMDSSLTPSTDSTALTPISQPGNKQYSIPISNVGEKKIKTYNGPSEQNRPPPCNDNPELEDYNNLPPEYCYDWRMGPYTHCPRGHYYNNLVDFNHANSRNYTSSHSSRDSDPTYNYDFPGPVYSERIRYTCRRVQTGDNANLISFIVFLILFIGLFQYLNVNIH